MNDTLNPWAANAYEGCYSHSDLIAATLARLDRLQPELGYLVDQLDMLGLPAESAVVEGLRALVASRAGVDFDPSGTRGWARMVEEA